MIFRERLRPHGGLFLALLLLVPALFAVFAKLNVTLAFIIGPVATVAVMLIIWFSSPTLEVSADTFKAGRAEIERTHLGDVTVYEAGDEATDQLRTRLDARAYLCVRGGLPLLKIENTDAHDPAPYWLVASRHPTELAAALTRPAAL